MVDQTVMAMNRTVELTSMDQMQIPRARGNGDVGITFSEGFACVCGYPAVQLGRYGCASSTTGHLWSTSDSGLGMFSLNRTRGSNLQ